MSEQKTLEIPMSDESAGVARSITSIDDARVEALGVRRRLRWV